MKLLTPSLLLITCFIIGGAVFKSIAPRQCATILPDDTIFVLTGDMRNPRFYQICYHAFLFTMCNVISHPLHI